MAFVIDKQIFGEVRADARVIDLQKRGLPHDHCIFFMTPQPKTNLLDPAFIDTIISAEILNMENNLCGQVVHEHNKHSRCGHLNPSAVCMIGNYCTKRFPKDLVEETGRDESQL